MKEQIPEDIKTKRSNILLELNEKKQKAYEEKLIGKTVEVLMEEAIERDGEIYQVGHTKEYVKVALKTEEDLSNRMTNVRIENHLQILR